MVRRRKHERSLFEALLPDADKLWPAWLKRIDTLLEDEAVIDTVASAQEQRWPQSRKRGREGTPAEVVLRMLILKHLHDWSFDELEQEVRANLVYRAKNRVALIYSYCVIVVVLALPLMAPLVVGRLFPELQDLMNNAADGVVITKPHQEGMETQWALNIGGHGTEAVRPPAQDGAPPNRVEIPPTPAGAEGEPATKAEEKLGESPTPLVTKPDENSTPLVTEPDENPTQPVTKTADEPRRAEHSQRMMPRASTVRSGMRLPRC